MTQPLALVLYERLLPGTQLVNRLQDIGYRVQIIHNPAQLVSSAEQDKPLVVFADLESTKGSVSEAISKLKQNTATKHLPVVAFAGDNQTELTSAAERAGGIITGEAALLHHLPQVLDQAIQLD